MPTNFPSSPDDIQNDVSNSTLEVDLHPGLHNQLADAVMAVQTELLAGGTMNLAAHVAAADPHAVYLTQTEGDARYTTIAGGIPDGAITSAKIADGAIQAADLADAAVTNAKLASDTARANLLTNGGFEIWQRGNGPFTGGYTADRWLLYLATSTVSVTRSATADGSSAAITYTHGASGLCHLYQKLEDYTQLRSRTVSFSLRVTSTVACTVFIEDSAGTTTGLVHTGDGSAQILTVTRAIGAVTYVQVGIRLNTASGTAYVDNAMLVVGATAADYAPLHPADDAHRCQRYYELIGAPGAGDIMINGHNVVSGNVLRLVFRFRAVKPVTPTVTKVGTWSAAVLGQPTTTSTSVEGTRVEATSSGSAADAYVLNGAAGNTITVEANI